MDGEEMRVGVFDSGIGGLTVLRDCVRELPQATFYYYGDNFRAPYGNRPPEEIEGFVKEGMDLLAGYGLCAAVLACNTATAVCAEGMRRRYPFPVIGMEPAVKPAAERYRKVLVLATARTAESERLRALIAHFPAADIEVFAAPALAGAIEAFLTRGTPFSLADHLPPASPQCVVLGCTHYAFVRRGIARFYGCEVFDGGEGTARHLRAVVNLGRDTHLIPPITTNDPVGFCPENSYGGVIFVGKTKKINEAVYKSNVCSIF